MSQAHSTESLVHDAKMGLPSAQAELIERNRTALTGYVRARVGSHLGSRVAVEDVVQEAFAKALRSLSTSQWQGEGSFLRWLKGIASNEILRLARQERQRAFIAVDPVDLPGDVGSPSRGLRREERFDRLQQALEGLSPEHREVIVLARLKGMRLADVAKHMGRTPNGVAQLLGRALTKLKEAFGDTESLSLPPASLGIPTARSAPDE